MIDIFNVEKPEYNLVEESFNKMHGNVYKIAEIEPLEGKGKLPVYSCELYNQLQGYCKGLDGHYTIVYTYPFIKFMMWKSSDYGSFTYVTEVPFEGFIEKTPEITAYITRIISNTMYYKEPYQRHVYASNAIFDEDIINPEWPKDWGENDPTRKALQEVYNIKKEAAIKLLEEINKCIKA